MAEPLPLGAGIPYRARNAAPPARAPVRAPAAPAAPALNRDTLDLSGRVWALFTAGLPKVLLPHHRLYLDKIRGRLEAEIGVISRRDQAVLEALLTKNKSKLAQVKKELYSILTETRRFVISVERKDYSAPHVMRSTPLGSPPTGSEKGASPGVVATPVASLAAPPVSSTPPRTRSDAAFVYAAIDFDSIV